MRLIPAWIPLLWLPLGAAQVAGRVTDGHRGLPGVRVYPDRTVTVRPRTRPPVAVTDAQGRFALDLEAGDTDLVVERPGWTRDLVPRTAWTRPVALRPAPGYRREPVLVVRLDFPGRPAMRTDAELRELLFGRHPGEASAATYFYEVSKGSLELEEGGWLHLPGPGPAPDGDGRRSGLVHWVLERLRGLDLRSFDRVDNRTGACRPDGKPDHLWIITPGPSATVTDAAGDLTPACLLARLPWRPGVRWPVVLFPDETPLGFIVHEALHAQGELRVDDLYLEGDPGTAGIWDVMDAGQFRGWERRHPDTPPWQEDTATSPSAPMGWVRADLWYRGAFRATVRTLRVRRRWTGWLDPLARAPGRYPQRLVVPDPRRPGRFWEFNVRRPQGFDRGRVGGRWGPGCQGLVVARVDPGRLTLGRPRGPVRVLDAHPGSLEPPPPRLPGGRWQLDDAAYNLGPGEVPAGTDGPLSWKVLGLDGRGRMRVRITVRPLTRTDK